MTGAMECLSCKAPLNAPAQGGKITCPYCGKINLIAPRDSKTNELLCPSCNAVNPGSAKHCTRCGVKLVFPCPKCGTPIGYGVVYCADCGVDVRAENFRLAEEEKRKQERAEQERIHRRNSSFAKRGITCFVLLAAALCFLLVPLAGYLFSMNLDTVLPAVDKPRTATTATITSLPTQTHEPSATETIPVTHTPQIEKIEFPSHIPGNSSDVSGKVTFTDPGGDVILINFAVIQGAFDPFSFDPMKSLTSGNAKSGVIGFSIWCNNRQTVTLSVTLKDKAGFVSPAVRFTFSCT